MTSAEVPDWERERIQKFWSPPRKLIKSIRDYQKYFGNNSLHARINKKIIILRHRFWSVITGADIPINVSIGGGLLIPHPNGIVIHSDARIGVNCLINQQVTVGVGSKNMVPPIIEGHVDIGAGAKIIGNISIGKHATIGANAVVISDIPEYAVAVGVPAKVVKFDYK